MVIEMEKIEYEKSESLIEDINENMEYYEIKLKKYQDIQELINAQKMEFHNCKFIKCKFENSNFENTYFKNLYSINEIA